MANLTSKKQNRILYLTLTALLIGAVALSVLTFQAAKKETDTLPETDIRQVHPDAESERVTSKETIPPRDTVKEDTGLFGKKEETETAPESNKPKKEAEKTGSEAEEAAAVGLTDILPVFYSPIQNGTILREHSVTVPVFSPTMEDYRTHTGVDILCSPASPVLAAADGKIGNVWYDPLMGYTISVIHSGDAVTIYQGIAEELPEGIGAGAAVKAGQVIACSGNTALIECEDEEHLHFMLNIGGTDVDPLEYIALPTMAEVYEY
ncbi:MAG: M23 family metallopeptidase [Clostridia bacterium]|nr:M23 family metallopeptidase [Clostridia bacterium]